MRSWTRKIITALTNGHIHDSHVMSRLTKDHAINRVTASAEQHLHMVKVRARPCCRWGSESHLTLPLLRCARQ